MNLEELKKVRLLLDGLIELQTQKKEDENYKVQEQLLFTSLADLLIENNKIKAEVLQSDCLKKCILMKTVLTSFHDVLMKREIQSIPKAGGLHQEPLFLECFEMIKDFREMMVGLANGNLNAALKYKGYTAGAIKNLQASLRHLTWQTQKIAEGDFTQRVDFMGEFSIAFNSMVEQLEKAVRELKTDKEKLAILNATKDKFFSIIAHDLRGPIGSMVSMLSILEDPDYDFEDDEFREIIESLAKSATLTFSLLENLLYWARNQRGEIEIERENVNLYALVQESIALLENMAKSKNITIKNELPLTEKVLVDSKMIKTVVRNLISNALKFTESGGLVKISLMKEEAKNVQVAVIDNGLGIEEEKLVKMFKIDSKIVSVGTKGEKGSGLGLLLCKDFVEQNGGKIWVESVLGKGSSFIFTLPSVEEAG